MALIGAGEAELVGWSRMQHGKLIWGLTEAKAGEWREWREARQNYHSTGSFSCPCPICCSQWDPNKSAEDWATEIASGELDVQDAKLQRSGENAAGSTVQPVQFRDGSMVGATVLS